MHFPHHTDDETFETGSINLHAHKEILERYETNYSSIHEANSYDYASVPLNHGTLGHESTDSSSFHQERHNSYAPADIYVPVNEQSTHEFSLINKSCGQRVGSEMNPHEKSSYGENDVVMYVDDNGLEHKGKIIDVSYSGGCDHYKIQRADGTCVLDDVGKADIEGEV